MHRLINAQEQRKAQSWKGKIIDVQIDYISIQDL